MGALEILNVGAGDVKITYDREDVAEAIRAKRIIKDMLKRGYALLVEIDGKWQRIKSFDEKHGEYVIADLVDEDDEAEGAAAQPGKKSIKERRVPMSRTRATGIGRSAGG